MKMNEFDVVHLVAVHPLPVLQAGRGWRGAIAALKTRLMAAWVGLYAQPPRRLGPMV
jgi:hypothetical protein